MKGDLILSRNYTFFGNKIRTITGGYYNHVGLFISDKLIVESNPGGVKIMPLAIYEKNKSRGKLDYDIFKFKDLTLEEKEKMCQFCLDKVGSHYDYLQFISIFLFFVFHVNRKIEPIDITEAFLCSELIAKALETIGRKFSDKIDIDNITPRDIEISDLIEKIK